MRRQCLLFGIMMFTFSAFGKGADSLDIASLNSKAFHYYLTQPDSAIKLANKALALTGNQYPFESAFSYYTLSKANWARANYFLSIVYGFKALKIYENTSYVLKWGETNLAIARTFVDLKNLDQAKVYLDKTYSLAKRNNNSQLLSDVFREKSFYFQVREQYDSALHYTQQGINLCNQRKDTLDLSIFYTRLARIYLNQRAYEKSLEFCRKGYQMDIRSGNNRGLAISYTIAAEIFYAIGRKDSAIYYLNKSIGIDKMVRNIPNMIRTHELLANIHAEKKEQSAVIENLRLINQLKDSLYIQSGNSQIQEVLTRYELESKERIIQLLENERALQQQKANNQNLIIGIFGIAIILISVLALAFWRMRQIQTLANKELALRNQDIALQNEEIQAQAESLQEVSALKSKLLSVISHDLRGPINNLQSLLDLLTRKLISPEEFNELSIKLKSNLNVSQRTLQNLLSWSLSQMEGIRTEPVKFDIVAVIKDVIDLYHEIAIRKNIGIEFIQSESVFAHADIDQVNLIVRNLTHNALKFCNENGYVRMFVRQQETECVIQIEDNGVGMTEAEIKTLLTDNEFFTRVGTNNEKGTGLGLLLCKDFIQRNNGRLKIDSSPYQGTKVEFTLPSA